jgi:hypothetical protein
MDFYQPISLTAGATLSKRTHAGAVLKLNAAAGQAIVLPASVGDGSRYELVVETTITSNSSTIKVANASDVMTGVAILGQDAADTAVLFETASTTDTITLNGSTTGGIKGDRIILADISANLWHVTVIGSASGTEATPFSASVS